MKKILLSMVALSVMSCASAVSPVMFPTSDPVVRQVERVVKRHDAYVFANDSLSEDERFVELAQSKTSLMLVQHAGPDGIMASELLPFLPPVLDRYDEYVEADPLLDQLERETYLGSSSGLRTLLTDSVWSQQ